MTATKLRELLGVMATPCDYAGRHIRCSCPRHQAIQSLERSGPDLARLVLKLETALTTVMALIEAEREPPTGATLRATIAAHGALAAVEEL